MIIKILLGIMIILQIITIFYIRQVCINQVDITKLIPDILKTLKNILN